MSLSTRKTLGMLPRSGRFVLAALLLGILGASTIPPSQAANKSQLSVYQHGKPVDSPPCPTPLAKQAAALMGGGTDVAAAYTWMIDQMLRCDGTTPSGTPGNFVVLRVAGSPAYDAYIAKLGPVASVITLFIPDRDSANDPALIPYLNNAGALFLTGGDQGEYYTFWKGTLLEKLISQQVTGRHIPIGGTSAGEMILSQFVYTSIPNSVTSTQALANPYLSGYMDIEHDFWSDAGPNGTPFPPITSTVTDSHLDTRDRMGRLVTFLGRVITDNFGGKVAAAQAIGVDEQTALEMVYDPKMRRWTANVAANPNVTGSAYILSASPGASTLTAKPGTPLTFTNINVQKLTASPSGGGSSAYQLNVVGGLMTSSGNGNNTNYY